MKSMLELEIAVLNQDQDSVQSILSELDRRTELEMFRKAAEYFGFQLLEHRGRGYAMRRQLAPILGYNGESGLRMLCERYDIETLSLGTFAQHVRDMAINQFGLSRNDGKSIFVGWDAFLLAGMESTTEAAKQVKIYLLTMERAGRVAGGALSLTESRHLRLKEANQISLIASRIDRMKDLDLRNRVGLALDEILEGALDYKNHGDLFTRLSKPDS